MQVLHEVSAIQVEQGLTQLSHSCVLKFPYRVSGQDD